MARRRRNKKWLWGLILVVLIGAGVGAYVIWANDHRDDGGGESVETTTDDNGVVESVDDTDVDTENTTEQDTTTNEIKKVTQYEGGDPNESEELTGIITYAGVENENLVVVVNIDQFLTEGGCVLSLINGTGAVVYEKTASILPGISTSTCDGFSVPVSELGSESYDINVRLKSGEREGLISGKANI